MYAEKAMAPHSSTLAWKIPWVVEPDRLQSMWLLRVGHDWVTSLSLFTFMHWRRKWQPTPVFLPGESQGWGSLVGCHLWGWSRVGHDWRDLACYVWVCAKSLQSCLTLCDTMDHSPPGSSVHGILQARILEWVGTPSSRGSSRPTDWTHASYVSCIGRQVLTTGATWEALISVQSPVKQSELMPPLQLY